eukprot:m.261937 g.261937  ORF g.261937 m.261937 type:complete len:482 (+) comp15584_c1_seq1:267-1712(+)
MATSAPAAIDVEVEEETGGPFPLHGWLVKQCNFMGFKESTPVQHRCIPPILEGKDVYAAAKTGSGKTGAFALPILNALAEDPFGVFAVVLTPTRELAYQIADQFRALGKPIGIKDCIIVGGVDETQQQLELARRPHVIVATPGRLATLLQGSADIHLDRVRFLVLDEADRLMANESMQDHMKIIIDAIPEEAQNLLFSATLLNEPTGSIVPRLHTDGLFKYAAPSAEATVSTLNQQYLFFNSTVRHSFFAQLMQDLEEDASKIVFSPTCSSCEELAVMLRELDIKCVSLHSQMSQAARLDALNKFKSGFIKVLVATDVASRGLDIPTVKFVVNFNVPKVVDDYIHRVGRTARAGRGGVAITLISPDDVSRIHAIEDKIGVKMSEYKLDEDAVLDNMSKANMALRSARLHLHETGFLEEAEKRKAAKWEKRQSRRSAKQHSKGAKVKGKKDKKGKKAKKAKNPASQAGKAKVRPVSHLSSPC